MKKDSLPYILIPISGLLWGAIGITVRLLASFGLTSAQIVVSRFITVAIVFALVIFYTDKRKFKIDKSDILRFILFGFACILAYNFCFAVTIQLTSISIAVALLYTSPVWAMLLSIPIFREKLTLNKALAILLSFSGCAVMSGLFSPEGLSLSPLGLLTGILSGIGYGSFGIFAKKLLAKYDAITTMLYPFLFAGIGGLFFCDIGGMAETVTTAPIVLAYIFFGALICYVIPYGLYTYSLNYIEASKAAVIVSIEPVFATIFGFVFFEEQITLSVVVGVFMILAAIFVLSRSKLPLQKSQIRH